MPTPTDSILLNTKQALGLAEAYVVFDPELIMHINSVLAELNQLGIGPVEGFMINDYTPTWNDLIAGDYTLNNVKSFVFLKVKMIFDPPQVGTVAMAYEKMIDQLTWRINVAREIQLPLPTPVVVPDDGDGW